MTAEVVRFVPAPRNKIRREAGSATVIILPMIRIESCKPYGSGLEYGRRRKKKPKPTS